MPRTAFYFNRVLIPATAYRSPFARRASSALIQSKVVQFFVRDLRKARNSIRPSVGRLFQCEL